MMTMYVSPYRRVARMREAMNRLLEENMGDMEQVNEREMLLAVDVQA